MGKRLLASGMILLLCLNMLGCGGSDSKKVSEGVTDTSVEGTYRGDYVEEKIIVSDWVKFSEFHDVTPLQNGIIYISGSALGEWITEMSTDGGESFAEAEGVGVPGCIEGYITYSAYLHSGECLFTSDNNLRDSTYNYYDADGNFSELVFSIPDDKDIDNQQIWAGEDGQFYLTTDQDMYRMSIKDCRLEHLLSFEELGYASFLLYEFAVCGDYIYLVGTGKQSGDLYIYDMERDMVLEDYESDEVLSGFIRNTMRNVNTFKSNSCSLRLVGDSENNRIYIVTNDGVYSHVPFGSTMELIINGQTKSFGDMELEFRDVDIVNDGDTPVFYMVLTDNSIYRYRYDENAEVESTRGLKVFSMYDSEAVKQAINNFRKEYPNVLVEYEVGCGEDSLVTENDVLQNLAISLAAGYGPDIIVMDGVPFESYVEKDVLMDLSGFVGELQGNEEIMPQLVDACSMEGKTYGIPMTFTYVEIMGYRKYLEGMNTLEQLADAACHADLIDESKELFSFRNARDALGVLSMGSLGSFMNEEKTDINIDVLIDYYTQTKRIWDAHMSGLSEYQSWGGNVYFNNIAAGNELCRQSVIGNLEMDAFNMWAYDKEFGIRRATASYEACKQWLGLMSLDDELTSIRMPGSNQNSCLVENVLAINSNTKAVEDSLEFLRLALCYDFQREYKGKFMGLPTNKAACEYVGSVQTGIFTEYSYTSNQGEFDGSTVYKKDSYTCPSAGAYLELWSEACEIEAVQTCPLVVYQKILEEGERVLMEECSVEEAAYEVERNVQIYLAE